jgi:hypothetical protein
MLTQIFQSKIVSAKIKHDVNWLRGQERISLRINSKRKIVKLKIPSFFPASPGGLSGPLRLEEGGLAGRGLAKAIQDLSPVRKHRDGKIKINANKYDD